MSRSYTAAGPQPNEAPAADGQPATVPPESAPGLKRSGESEATKSETPQARSDAYDPRSFGAGVTKGRSEAEEKWANKHAELQRQLDEIKQRYDQLDGDGSVSALRKTHEQLQRDLGVMRGAQTDDVKARAARLPEMFRGIVLRKLDAGKLEDALRDLGDLETVTLQRRPPLPAAGAIPDIGMGVPLVEYDRLVRAGHADALRQFRKQYGDRAVDEALRQRRSERLGR